MPDTFLITQNNTSPAVRYVLTPAADIDLTGGSVSFTMEDKFGAVKINAAAAVIETASGTPTVRYDWTGTDTDTPGLFFATFKATYADATTEDFPNDGRIMVIITEENG